MSTGTGGPSREKDVPIREKGSPTLPGTTWVMPEELTPREKSEKEKDVPWDILEPAGAGIAESFRSREELLLLGDLLLGGAFFGSLLLLGHVGVRVWDRGWVGR